MALIPVLAVIVLLSLGASFLCSLTEAAIYAVPIAHVKHLAEKRSRRGLALQRIKEDIGRAIAAILVINTLCNIAGPTVGGWIIGSLFPGNSAVLIAFSAGLALMILLVGEILPKTIGVVYCRSVASLVAPVLLLVMKLLSPLLSVSKMLDALLRRGREAPSVSPHEVISLTEMGQEEGALDELEGEVIQNVIGLDRVLVRDILTPRVVVFRLCEETRLEDVRADIGSWRFSRIPLFPEGQPESLTSYVTQRDVYRALFAASDAGRLREISRPLNTVPELLGVDKLLLQMVDDKEHICAVVDEHGGFAGIITLEDILEELLGREIVDEYDAVADLRAFAKVLRLSRRRSRKPSQSS